MMSHSEDVGAAEATDHKTDTSSVTDKPGETQPPTFPLSEKPTSCWAGEHLAAAKIERRTMIHETITRPYYICTICGSDKCNGFRDSGYPRGFVTWDDDIGVHQSNPPCHCGLPSRQDRKGRRAMMRRYGDGFWVCASGACHYFSDRRDGSSYEDARRLLDSLDEFWPDLLDGVPVFY